MMLYHLFKYPASTSLYFFYFSSLDPLRFISEVKIFCMHSTKVIDSILNYSGDHDNYYNIIGCSPHATVSVNSSLVWRSFISLLLTLFYYYSNPQTDQILVEFKIKAKLFHPDKIRQHGLNSTPQNDNDNSQLSNSENQTEANLEKEISMKNDEFKRLLEAKEVLTDVDRRREYDIWRESGLSVPFPLWKSLHASHVSYIKLFFHFYYVVFILLLYFLLLCIIILFLNI